MTTVIVEDSRAGLGGPTSQAFETIKAAAAAAEEASDLKNLNISSIGGRSGVHRWTDHIAIDVKESLERFLIWAASVAQASDISIKSSSYVRTEVAGRLEMVGSRTQLHNDVQQCANLLFQRENASGLLQTGKDLDFAYTAVDRSTRERYRFRVNMSSCQDDTVPQGMGIEITLRALPSKPWSVTDLGVPSELVALSKPEKGLLAVVGATGDGKSSFLAAIIRSFMEDESSTGKILTYEKPIEYMFDKVESKYCSIVQTEVGHHLKPSGNFTGPEFAYCIRNALRRKPTAIMIGECRDKDTFAAAFEVAMAGHIGWTTFHAKDVRSAIRRATTVFSPEEREARAVDFVDSAAGIVAQNLLKTTDGRRVAIREWLEFTPAVRRRFLSSPNSNWPLLADELIRKHGRPYQADLDDHLRKGRISQTTYDRRAIELEKEVV